MSFSEPQRPVIYKVVMVGKEGCGKSSMTLQYMYNEFVEDYEPTKADSYRKKVILDEEEIIIDILDMAGHEEENMHENDRYIKNGDGFICVFSIADKESFESVLKSREHVLRLKDTSEVPLLLVGCKSDLEEQREVMTEKAAQIASQWNVGYIEASAKTRANVELAFQELLRKIREKKLASNVSSVGKKSKKQSKGRKNKCCIS